MPTPVDTKDEALKFRVQDLFRGDVGADWKRYSAGGSVCGATAMCATSTKRSILFEKYGYLGDVGIEKWMVMHTTGDWITDVRVGYALTTQFKASFIVNNLSNEVYAISAHGDRGTPELPDHVGARYMTGVAAYPRAIPARMPCKASRKAFAGHRREEHGAARCGTGQAAQKSFRRRCGHGRPADRGPCTSVRRQGRVDFRGPSQRNGPLLGSAGTDGCPTSMAW